MTRILAAGAALWLVACGASEGWSGKGVVRGVLVAENQIKIEHGDIEDLMPAMTMSFDVSDPGLLIGIREGMEIEFKLRKSDRVYEIFEIHPVGEAPKGRSGGGFSMNLRTRPSSVVSTTP